MSDPAQRSASQAPDSKINAEDGRKYWQSKVWTGLTSMLLFPTPTQAPETPPSSLVLSHTSRGPLLLTITRALHYLQAIETDWLTLAGVGERADVDADVNGMLGGFPYVSRVDLQGSRNFLAKFGIGTKDGQRTVAAALEGGAGIGRITEGLLLSLSQEVDVVEPIAKFTEALESKSGVRKVYNIGLEEWRPDVGVKYDLVWNQWCVGHLKDQELAQYLERCKTVLAPGDGLIVVKENISTSGVDLFDDQDSSVTRTDEKFQAIFKDAGLKLVKAETQRGFPKELFPVRIYALRPRE